MSSEKTIQLGSTIPPKGENDTLALIIKCAKCDTQRAFRVNDGFMGVILRKSSGLEYSTVCSKCQTRFPIQLVWTRRQPGWTAERVTFENAVRVTDNLEMYKREGGKAV